MPHWTSWPASTRDIITFTARIVGKPTRSRAVSFNEPLLTGRNLQNKLANDLHAKGALPEQCTFYFKKGPLLIPAGTAALAGDYLLTLQTIQAKHYGRYHRDNAYPGGGYRSDHPWQPANCPV